MSPRERQKTEDSRQKAGQGFGKMGKNRGKRAEKVVAKGRELVYNIWTYGDLQKSVVE